MLPPLIKAMLEPDFYPHPVRKTELVQTHISWVLLTGTYAYKVKKPVDFGFLDFSTLEKRRFFCAEEVRLNRRLSPDIYLGVVGIRWDGRRFVLEGEGGVVEYAVKMHELDKQWRLDLLLEKRGVDLSVLEEIGEKIALFHAQADTDERIASFGRPEKVRVNVQENFEQTVSFIGVTIDKGAYEALKDYSFRFLQDRSEVFSKRIRQGRIREGHGDLHAANVYYDGQRVYVLDCIEFNERFRFQDTASDVAFLAMDLEFRGHKREAWAFLNAYLSLSGDYGLFEVLRFYKIYRAYVRGKVEGFRLKEDPEAKGRAKSYFDLALSYLGERPRRFILCTCGLMGTGKSTLSKALGAWAGIVVLRSDTFRKLLFGIPPWEHRYEPWGKGIYGEDATERVYEQMVKAAKEVLEAGYPVLLDATFAKRKQREKVLKLAEDLRVPCLFLYLQCPLEVLKKRLEGRKDISDGRPEILEDQVKGFEEPMELVGGRLIVLDTSFPWDIEMLWRKVEEKLR